MLYFEINWMLCGFNFQFQVDLIYVDWRKLGAKLPENSPSAYLDYLEHVTNLYLMLK